MAKINEATISRAFCRTPLLFGKRSAANILPNFFGKRGAYYLDNVPRE